MLSDKLLEIESFAALGCNAGFADYAAWQIMSLINLKRGLDRSTCYYMLISAMRRQDKKVCVIYAGDWGL